MTTIGLADYGAGLPVSTTHVLSSGVAGTMAANRSGLQWSTVRNIGIAWVLTMPVCMTTSSAVLYVLFRWLAAVEHDASWFRSATRPGTGVWKVGRCAPSVARPEPRRGSTIGRASWVTILSIRPA